MEFGVVLLLSVDMGLVAGVVSAPLLPWGSRSANLQRPDPEYNVKIGIDSKFERRPYTDEQKRDPRTSAIISHCVKHRQPHCEAQVGNTEYSRATFDGSKVAGVYTFLQVSGLEGSSTLNRWF